MPDNVSVGTVSATLYDTGVDTQSVPKVVDLSQYYTKTEADAKYVPITVAGVATARILDLTGTSTDFRGIQFKTGSLSRWAWVTDGSAETGANAGTNLTLVAYDDAGAFLTEAFRITRSTGLFETVDGLKVNGNITGHNLDLSNTGASFRSLQFKNGTMARWALTTDGTTEGGSDQGTNLNLISYTDAGAFLAVVLELTRATGMVSFGRGLRLNFNTPPATATSSGVSGQVAWDSGFVYVCTATNTWKRAAISSW